ncbi:hypothetical protein AB0I60_03345 [Actinosynnema sp. NPDC050436]|uniref:hypothetical protein n=1 Tax=Actinosynnema sp. NPDC050436 TaxID=3155659 RepID=UPI0033E9BE46
MTTGPDHLALARALRAARTPADAAKALAGIEESGPPPDAARPALRDVLLDPAFVRRTEDAPAPIDVLGDQLPVVYSTVVALSLGDAVHALPDHVLGAVLHETTSADLVQELVRRFPAAGRAGILPPIVRPGLEPQPAPPLSVVFPMTAPGDVPTWRDLLTSTRVLVLAGLLLFLAGLVVGLLQPGL